MNPKNIKPGQKLWVRSRELKNQLVEIYKITDKSIVLKSNLGGLWEMPLKRFWKYMGKFNHENTYEITVITLCGGWKDYEGGNKLKEVVRKAYLHAKDESRVRWVYITHHKRCGLRTRLFSLAGYNDRVWMTRHGSLSALYWKGKIPKTEDKLIVEITGKFEETPPSFEI